MLGFQGRPDTGTFDVRGWCCIHGYGIEGNSSVGSDVEGGEEGGDGVNEGVSDESRGNRRDVEVFEYEMELARMCSGENGEF